MRKTFTVRATNTGGWVITETTYDAEGHAFMGVDYIYSHPSRVEAEYFARRLQHAYDDGREHEKASRKWTAEEVLNREG